MNKWEKMEYVFEVDVNNNLEVDKNVGLYITPLEFAKQYYDLYVDREADDYLLNVVKILQWNNYLMFMFIRAGKPASAI